ncbi:hypothetical protein [Streptomyces sp. NBC_00158]|uniref:hypothetical protein n=1 Tax=Streptomyces sp. NBC_00158 TaxID=2903627 RepID=UPI0032568555
MCSTPQASVHVDGKIVGGAQRGGADPREFLRRVELPTGLGDVAAKTASGTTS